MINSRYRCTICSHVYDPHEGDPITDVPPGHSFADLPESWMCPECSASKADFEPLED